MAYQSTKRYGHELGLSCAFRQWRADSHCKFVHGYALGFKFIFEADELDQTNWVVDFGGLKSLKKLLENTFDHKTVVSIDDPHIEFFKRGQQIGVFDLVIVEDGGCEKFAELVYRATDIWLREAGFAPRCRLVSVEVNEHGANSAIFTG
jgi:6-pyruvoyltetrahydropterin/6-carboxytetrahydropterin synthase